MMARTQRLAMIVATLGCAVILGACGGGDGETAAPSRDIIEVMDDHADELVAIDGVSAVGVSRLPTGRRCVRIYVIEFTDELRALLPTELEGHPVDIVVSGDFVPVEKAGDS